MAKILNGQGLNGSLAKVVELSNEYVLNGHVYDKNTLAPRALNFVPTYASNNNEMLLYKTMYLDTDINRNVTNRSFAIDNNDPSITYVFPASIYRNNEIQKIKKVANGMEVLATTTTGDVHGDISEVIAQDNYKIYTIYQRTYDNTWSYIEAYTKDKLFNAWGASLGRCRVKLIKETSSSIYFSATYELNVIHIKKVDKIYGTVTTLISSNMGGYDNLCIPTTIDENNAVYFTKDTYSETGLHTLGIRKYTIDFDTDLVTFIDSSIDLTLLSPTNSMDQTIDMGVDNVVAYELFFVDNIDGKYLNLMVFDYGLKNPRLPNNKCALYTFKMDTVDSFTLIDYQNFSPIVYKGLLSIYNNKVIILADDRGVTFYNWNANQRKFERTNYVGRPVLVVGIDMGNNVWLQYRDGEVDLFANTLPIKIEADFVEEEYNFIGENIDSNVFVRAENYLGKKLATKVELQLIGNVIFTENGLKTISKTTSETSDLIIPVTINDAGVLQISVKNQ